MAKRSIEDKLQESLNHWQYLYHFGGHDPFWSDGCNLNLVRNHISRYKEEIEELYPNGDYPEVYYQDTPPEVSNDYMARTKEIKENAANVLETCKKDPNYNMLLCTVLKLNKKIQEQTSINNVIWYVKGLEKAILQNDLISMRRANAERYLSAFKDCVKRVNGLYQHEEEQQGQLSLF